MDLSTGWTSVHMFLPSQVSSPSDMSSSSEQMFNTLTSISVTESTQERTSTGPAWSKWSIMTMLCKPRIMYISVKISSTSSHNAENYFNQEVTKNDCFLFTFLADEGQWPREDVHEVGQPIRVRRAVELPDVHDIVLVFQHSSFREQKGTKWAERFWAVDVHHTPSTVIPT